MNQAKTEWDNGTLGSLTMHACRPDVATCDFEGGASPVKGSRLSDAEWSQLITDGTPLNNDYKAKLDQFVPYFQQLKDAGIPVLFRPLHEMNEGWAWWGGTPGPNGSARLYQITHDYLAVQGPQQHHLGVGAQGRRRRRVAGGRATTRATPTSTSSPSTCGSASSRRPTGTRRCRTSPARQADGDGRGRQRAPAGQMAVASRSGCTGASGWTG